ncbi:MAG: protease SohB [Deltaproteobacteria bacterium]|nr:protease SohB [Deltaproteobacteria bacterium]
MEFLREYAFFFLETFTVVFAILFVAAGLVSILMKGQKEKGKLIEINNISEKYESYKNLLQKNTLSKKALKGFLKSEKQRFKLQKKELKTQGKNRLFLLRFNGDIRASAVESLREEITAVLSVADQSDEVLLSLESSGGMVHAYGLAASQLLRLKSQKIPLTVAVDKIAASGGYLMACVGDKIIAAPFAIIGSIGVLAQIPNFNRLLKENKIDFEQITAGEHKRTLSLFGENTEKGRVKLQEEIEETHQLFKNFILKQRNITDLEKIATGEHWYGSRAKELNLIDDLMTSDDYLLEKSKERNLFEITYKTKRGLFKKLGYSAKSKANEIFGYMK